jgi:hypothetical protein
MACLRSWLLEHEQSFKGREGKCDPHRWLGKWPKDGSSCDIFPGALHEMLEGAGYHPVEAVLREWRERGYIDFQGDRLTTVTKISGVSTRVYRLKMSVIHSETAKIDEIF